MLAAYPAAAQEQAPPADDRPLADRVNWHEGSPGTTCIGAIAGCVRGGEEKIWTVGLNWYFNNNILLRFNYLNVDVDRLSATGAQIGQKFNAYALRLQFTN